MTRRPQRSKRERSQLQPTREITRKAKANARRRRRHELVPGPELFASGDPVDDLDRSYGPR
jgi:hypothetical protein